ncbi:MAG: DUF488 domain-containing protein [Anaerolineales bacterium]|nr:DUF488 domain-containing protein [Anaerolineales bacterium]
MTNTAIFTIGYGKREIADLLAVLQSNQIDYLIDVRSSPYSSYKPEFSQNALQAYLEAQGIRYVFMGDLLGGQPDDRECYIDGKVDYARLAQQPNYRAGVERLHKASREGRHVVLMCSEGKPENCHRSKLIGQTLSADGIEVLHIDEHDALISQQEVLLRLMGGQPSLFGDQFFTFTSRKKYQDDSDPLDEA